MTMDYRRIEKLDQSFRLIAADLKDADAPQCFHISQARHTHHEGSEHHRHDHHLDEIDEDGADGSDP